MIHGGDVISYSDKFEGEIIDFSSNINPLGPPEGLKDAINAAYAELVRYPDIRYRELKANVAAYLGCDQEQVIHKSYIRVAVKDHHSNQKLINLFQELS